MIRLRLRYFQIALFSFLLIGPTVAAIARPRIQTEDPQALISRARQALERGDAESVKAMGANSGTLSWLDRELRRAKWKVSLLSVPGKSGANPLAVFHDFHTCESISDHIHPLVKNPEGWRIGPEIPETDTRGFRIRDHDIGVRLDLANHRCSITDQVRIERQGREKVGLLRLSADMIVQSVTKDGKAFPAAFVPGAIAFEAPLERTFTLRLQYKGTVNHPHSDYILPTEAVLTSYWYPHIGRLPSKHGVTVTVPRGWLAVGQGELKQRVDEANESTFRFRNEIDTCYFTLTAGPYKVTTREVDGRKLSICELKVVPGRAEKSLDDLSRSIAFFSKSFGEFPYTHYEIVETMQPFGGALEAYSFATFQSMTIPGAVVHEVAHTWWGGVVPNPYTRTMWNESFASYSDGLFRRQTGRTSRSISTRLQTQTGARAIQGMHSDPQRGRAMLQSFRIPISQATDTSNPGHGSAGYGKGSLVLSMLEDLLGTEKMITCMRRFYQDHRRGEAADWADFERAVKKESGQDYGWFFRQWIERGGVPQVRLADVTVTSDGDKYLVKGRILQEGLPYRLRVPIRVDTAGETARAEIEIDGAETLFELPASAAVRAIYLDPDGGILMAGAMQPDERADPFKVEF